MIYQNGIMLSSTVVCPYASECPGCDWIRKPYDQQSQQKIRHFLDLMGPDFEKKLAHLILYQSFAPHGLRDRLDFVMQNGRCGLFSKKSDLVDLPDCLQLSPALQNFYNEFRKIPFPDLKGSFRLRVSPKGERGAWLDFANVDIKKLLDEKQTLQSLQELAFVEIGQKHKALTTKPGGSLGLTDPQFQPWFQSYYQNQPVDLYSTIGSFTQPSHVTNAWITRTLGRWFQDLKPGKVLEFGSGIGNLTLPALSCDSTEILSLELDPRSASAQDFTLKKHGLRDRVDLRVGDFRTGTLKQLPDLDVFLVNPARNGVGSLFESSFEVLQDRKPRDVIYMSCYPESFAVDTQSLIKHGYSPKQIFLVDQFPQTHHVEILSHWACE